MIKNFLIINFIGEDDKLGLRINKDFFTHKFVHKKNNDQLVFELLKFLNSYNATLDENFSVMFLPFDQLLRLGFPHGNNGCGLFDFL